MTYPPDRIRVSGINPSYDRFSGGFEPSRLAAKKIYDKAEKGEIEEAVQMIYAEDNPDLIIEEMGDIKSSNEEEKRKIITTLKMRIKEKMKNGFEVNQKIYGMVKDAIKLAGRNDFDRIKLYVPSYPRTKRPTVDAVMNNPKLVILYCSKNKDTVCQKCGEAPIFIDNEKNNEADPAKISGSFYEFKEIRFAKVYDLKIKQDPKGEYEIDGQNFDIRIK